jgi:hypothetical protein
MNDPRDKGFNYGSGWGSGPKPPAYATAVILARKLGQRAIEMSRQAWAFEMRLRSIRLASTSVEKIAAVQTLEVELREYFKANPPTEPAKQPEDV